MNTIGYKYILCLLIINDTYDEVLGKGANNT